VPSVLERISDSFRATFLAPLQFQAKSLRDPNLAALMNGTTTETGVTVNEASALHYPAVWAAVQCIAGDVASLPFFHYQRRGEAKERYTTSKLYRVLHDEFNPEMSAMVGRETMTAHVLLWGNAYAEIVRNDLGQVVALYPIEPNRVWPDRQNGRIIYRVQTGDGREAIVPAERMLHVVGLGYNGLMGYSVISMMRESLGVGMAAERLGGQVMSRGAKYSGFFEHPRTLGTTAHKNLKESMTSDLPGTYRILEEGMTYKPGSMPLRDAQFMEIRKYSVTDVARIFGIPPHKLGDLERATYSNIEESNIDYVISTLRRWLVRWEQECNRKLILPLEKTQQFTEHLVDGLLRGNIQSRYSAYSQGVTNGYLSPNDIRRYENLDPIEGGDTYLVQGAMVPLDRLDDLIDARIEKASQTDTLTPTAAAEPTPDVTPEAAPGRALLPAAPEPAPPLALPPAPAPEAESVRSVLETLVAEFRAESRATGVSVVAGRLVRKELAQLRKRIADPTAAVMRLEKFYRRFVVEGAAELTPWCPNPETRANVLTAWADAAMRTCVVAVQMEGGLATLTRAWERDREADLRQLLLEVTHGDPRPA
jgi:HK97 family phage portal protein